MIAAPRAAAQCDFNFIVPAAHRDKRPRLGRNSRGVFQPVASRLETVLNRRIRAQQCCAPRAAFHSATPQSFRMREVDDTSNERTIETLKRYLRRVREENVLLRDGGIGNSL